MAQTGEQFGFDGAVEGVVDALVDGRFDPAVRFTDLAHLRYFPRHVVGYGEPVEEALFMEFVDASQCVDVGSRPVRCVQVPHVDFLRVQRL